MKKILLGIFAFALTFTSYANGDKPAPGKGISNSPMKIRDRAARPDVPGSFVIDIGWNLLQDAPDLLETGIIGSRTLNLYYYYDIPIGNSNFVLMPGFGVGLDRYKFDNDVTLISGVDADGNDVVSIIDLNDALEGADIKKSQLIANYVDIPLEIRFYANPDDKKRSFHVSAGGKAGVRFSSHTKLKYELNDENIKTKDKKDFGLNRFRYGVSGRIGVGGFNVFYYYSLSELFDEGPADTTDTANMTIGLSFTGF